MYEDHQLQAVKILTHVLTQILYHQLILMIQITWTNPDRASHTVTSGNQQLTGPDGYFDSGLMLAGQTFSYQFTRLLLLLELYDYFCMVHPWMEGTVIVKAGPDWTSST